MKQPRDAACSLMNDRQIHDSWNNASRISSISLMTRLQNVYCSAAAFIILICNGHTYHHTLSHIVTLTTKSNWVMCELLPQLYELLLFVGLLYLHSVSQRCLRGDSTVKSVKRTTSASQAQCHISRCKCKYRF